MTYIKKLMMHGFKSFAKKTELPFTEGINVILGPNGSGKSNISDALCFVLGRLSIKSMRAEKAGNLIFAGVKDLSPSKEAVVEVVFDNEKKEFSLDSSEISIKRIVRRNGQSIYRINEETKTRQEVLTLLAQAGIDPNGFNIILQGEIQNFVRMHGEDRRKVIEEVAGISIYESRKEKSLSELEKTEEKLKEVGAILRERTAYLANLEKERQQALKFKKLEEDVKKLKASVINFDLSRKQKEIEAINSEISRKEKDMERIRKERINLETEIENLKSKISSINSTMQKSTGLEQEKLNKEIADIRAELAGIHVRLENSENRLSRIMKEKQNLQEAVSSLESSMKELQKESPSTSRNQKEIEIKKKELEKAEEERKKFYSMRSELKSLRERIDDKKIILQNYMNESDFVLKQTKTLSMDLFDIKTNSTTVNQLKSSLAEKKEIIENLVSKEKEFEKLSYTDEYEIERQNKVAEDIAKMDVCPLCKSKITKEHILSINREISPRVESLRKQIDSYDKKLSEIAEKKEILQRDIEQIMTEISRRESDLIIISSVEEKKNQIKVLQEKIEGAKNELSVLEKRRKNLEASFNENSGIEQKCENLRLEIQEISLRSKETITSEISFKKRELDRLKNSLKQFLTDESDIREDIKEITDIQEEKEIILKSKREKEEELTQRFQKMISERDALQNKIRDNEILVSEKQNLFSGVEQQMNNMKIDKARVDAEAQNLEVELSGFGKIEIIKTTNREALLLRLGSNQEALSRIGSVNLRSLEVYDSIKKEYDSIKEKMDIISKEKDNILKVITEIDIKKKKTFLRTLTSLNEIFSRNFSQLSVKGQVFLDLENKKEPFEGGVNIIVKTGHGKYFDVKSLSGGEQTIVALSLIFAIQELSPYYFYILDEIDAALDKRNSARLASLLQKYMRKGQYIIITHNDEVIANATNLYGVSMNDGVSKVVSLKI
ncbi:MAG TPA: chromosome segregation SMC family protein [Patescibacteria group bacterium]|nr:chromosome segregation SMC family protein [Patescibacteria group bacterium]